jgi:hypothetical protein
LHGWFTTGNIFIGANWIVFNDLSHAMLRKIKLSGGSITSRRMRK